ncbi:MAG TPA: MFS transporter [Spirochaetota bacterium]|nr:MFS transporter [Spirochaetota bacterium]HPI90164.1 MFS transporter [Spirochaetota bacterium]HPR48923.1 MFS transporter [Spirochaetota bacterium]
MLDQKRSILSWALYDWADSAFATTVMAGFFPVFFKEYWAGAGAPEQSTFYLGLANSAASIIVAVLSPFLGAVADRGSSRKKFLMLFTFLGVVMTGALWLVGQGNWQMAVLFYVCSSVGFFGGNIFYDSLLTSVSSDRKMDFTSSLGYALGYIGGGLLFLVNVIMYLKPHLFGIPDGATAIRISFLTVALWWGCFSLPLFFFVKEPDVSGGTETGSSLAAGWRQLAATFRDLRHLRVVALFLAAYWLYIDGVDTIIKMAVDYGKSLGFESSSLLTALLMVQFIAFPAALLYGKIAEAVGTRRALLAAIAGYGIITILGFFMTMKWHFFVLAGMVGLFQGGIQALSRSFYTRIIPVDKSAQFFGFYNMLGKFAAVIGPAMMGSIAFVTGNVRYGILSILVLFILGGLLLSRVDVRKGRDVADKYL